MLVIIGGGGQTGTQLATLLMAQHHQVHVIEHRREVLSRLHRELPTEVIYEGYPTDLLILSQAGVEQAQVVAACTVSDADNLAICYLARTRYQVPRTIARINNPRNGWLFGSPFHVDAAFNQAKIMAGLIEEEMPAGAMLTLLKLNRGDFSLVEEKISENALAIGRTIQDLGLPENCVIAGIIRDEQMIVPRGQTVFQAGDEVLAVVDSAGAEQLASLLTTGKI